MAGMAIIPFNEASSTFALEGEPSPVNLALATMEVDQEGSTWRLTRRLSTSPRHHWRSSLHQRRRRRRGAPTGGRPNPWFAEPPRRPLGLPFDAAHHQEDLRQEGQVLGLRRFCTSHDGDAHGEGRLQAPLRRSASTDATRGGSGACILIVHKEW